MWLGLRGQNDGKNLTREVLLIFANGKGTWLIGTLVPTSTSKQSVQSTIFFYFRVESFCSPRYFTQLSTVQLPRSYCFFR